MELELELRSAVWNSPETSLVPVIWITMRDEEKEAIDVTEVDLIYGSEDQEENDQIEKNSLKELRINLDVP